MADLLNDLSDLSRLGRSEAAHGRPPSNALQPDANESAERHRIYSRFQAEESKALGELRETQKRISGAGQDLAQLETSAVNLSDPRSISNTMDVALSEKRTKFVRDLKREKSTRAALLRFRFDRGIDREARYDTSAWGLLQWMVIIFAVELVLNSYFYSVHVGLAGGAIVAAIFSLVTAGLGFFTGLLFRLAHQRSTVQRLAGVAFIVAGSLLILYVASLTATYRSISIVQREQEASGTATLEYVPAYVVFTEAFGRAPEIFSFPVTGKLPFEDLQSFLLFLLSLIAFGVAFWKGYTSQDSVWGYRQMDEAYKKACTETHDDEQDLINAAKQAAYACAAERRAIIESFNTVSRQLALSRAEVDRLQIELTNAANSLAREFAQRIEAYRDAIVHVLQTPPPVYFAEPPSIELDAHESDFAGAFDQISQHKATLDRLMSAYADRLKAEITDASGQARVANDRVTAFKTDCERQAEREMQEEVRVVGPTSRLETP